MRDLRLGPARWVAGALCLGPVGCYGGGAGGADDASASAATTSAGEAAGTDESGESGEEEPAGCAGAPTEFANAPARLLTRFEYDNTVRDLLQDSTRPARAFPGENKTAGFENNATLHVANPLLVRKYMEVAESVAARAVQTKLGKLLPCDPVAVGEQLCGQQFVERLVYRAFRRPPEPAELQVFLDLYNATYPVDGLQGALGLVLEVVLQSPQFLYRNELPTAAEPEGVAVPVRGFEMATRLSYFLHASTPDDELLAAAAEGRLETREDIEAQARRLLESPKARDTLRSFHRQWLGLDALTSLVKDPNVYPGFEASYLRDWQDSVLSFIEYVFFNDGSLDELFSSPAVFLTDGLAAWYGHIPAVSGDGTVIQKYEFPGERWGLLTQPGMMALLSYADQGSPIARGVFMRKHVLCQELAPPPPDVMVTPPSPDPNATTRERFRQHTEDVACSGCHLAIDSLGFGFENYDGIGRWRVSENGLPIDASGEVLGAGDDALNGGFAGPAELSAKLVGSSDLTGCVTTKWFTYALGRPPSFFTDQCSTERAQQTLAETGDLRELVVAVVLSDAFMNRAPKTGGGL